VTVRANGFPQQADTWVATSGTPTSSTAGSSCAHPGFVVDGVDDQVEIGYAITDVTAGGTVHLCAGVYHVTAGQGYGKSFTLAGAGRDATVIVGTAIFNANDEYVSGGSEFLWTVGTPHDPLTLSLRDLTIRNFYGDGGGYGALCGEDYVLDRVRMDHNGSIGGMSGAIEGGNVTVRNSIFSKNFSNGSGGAIAASRFVASYSTFSDNVSTNRGGAISARTGSLARVDFFRNRAAFEGGALAVSGSGTFTVTHSRFWKNHAVEVGGALWSSGLNVTVQLSRFTSNVSDIHGGAIYAYQGSLNVVSSRFGHNRSVESAGAIASTLQNSFAVSRSTFYKNRAGAFGGAITVNGTVGKQMVVRSTFLRNSASLGGGALFMDGGDYEVGGVTADLSGVRLNSFLRNSGADGGAITVSLCDAVSAASKAHIRRVNTYVRNTSPIGEPAVFFATYGC
jgi:predicted outer membrane repeat protein